MFAFAFAVLLLYKVRVEKTLLILSKILEELSGSLGFVTYLKSVAKLTLKTF